MKTELVYLSDMSCLACEATVLATETTGSGARVVLDRTPLFPRGGGQPSDVGWITGPEGGLFVTGADMEDGVLWHTGSMGQGALRPSDRVQIKVDGALRRLHSRIHTAGELICACIREAGHNWFVAGAMHYPGSAKIVYEATLEQDKRESLAAMLDDRLAARIAEKLPVSISVTEDRAEVRRLCGYDPDYIPQGEPIRVVHLGLLFARPCMGTHVAHTGEIGAVTLRGIKLKKGQTTIGYDVI